ncbi:hypothetical protein EDD21DRAFT_440029 [Dissophora ornata]|nr:hypothetical protein EDD21DRAFT_440029 [Dissophora ornata]
MLPALGSLVTTEARELHTCLEKLITESWPLKGIPDATLLAIFLNRACLSLVVMKLEISGDGSTLSGKARDLAIPAVASQKEGNERAKEPQGAQVSKAIATFQVDTYRTPPAPKKKKWTVYGGIRFNEAQSVYYVDPADSGEHNEMLKGIEEQKLIMLEVNLRGDEAAFWTTFGNALRFNHSNLEAIETLVDFLKAFSHNAWVKNEKIVVLIDEFDLMYEASNDTGSRRNSSSMSMQMMRR